ncbi:MAG: winged helix-turn-helix transcriptional regulator [Actinomycetota bacterium]
MSDRTDDVLPLVAGLEEGGHRVGFAAFGEPATGPDPDVLLVDAVKDMARARDHCRAARSSSGRLRIIAILSVPTLDALGPDWDADSFLVDGCTPEEALARIRLALGPQIPETGTVIRVGDLAIDPDTYQVRMRGRPLDLTYKEFQLLSFLAQRPGRVFSRSMLLQEVWGYDFFGGTRTVDVHVRRLRAKLGAEHESMIATVRNVGYKMEAPPRARG